MKKKQVVTLDAIKALFPCQDRLDNYIKFYGDKSFTTRQFMGLKNITHQDKLWVAFRLIPKDKVKLVAADIAESVLHIYEAKYPNDDRPRKAVEAARAGKLTKKIKDDAADAAAASASAAYVNAAYAASAAYAAYAADADVNAAYAASAAYAAYAAADAAYADVNADAAYADVNADAAAASASAASAASAAYAAAAAAADAAYAASASARIKQEKLIRTIILRYWK